MVIFAKLSKVWHFKHFYEKTDFGTLKLPAVFYFVAYIFFAFLGSLFILFFSLPGVVLSVGIPQKSCGKKS